jgi:replicative DNA helicase
MDDMRVPPASTQAEQSVIGSLMIDNATWDVISDTLTTNDFYTRSHQVIYGVISELANSASPFDIVTMSEKLRAMGELDSVGGIAYLAGLCEDTPTAANILAYAKIVSQKSMRRRVIRAIAEIDALTHDGKIDNKALLSDAEKLISDIAITGHDGGLEVVGIKASLHSLVGKIEQRYANGNAMTGAPTGLTDLDTITHGLQRKDLIILAARPSMGKSAMMMRVVEAVAFQKHTPNVLVFSLEMPESGLSERLIASVGRISLGKIKTGSLDDSDWPRMTAALSLLTQTKIHYCDTSSISLSEMRTIIRRVEREHGKLDLVAVDYLQLIEEKGESQTHTIAKISTGLKKIAKDFDVPMLALSQLNRDLEKRADKRPQMADLRQSGQIEQDADLIMFLYRDEVYNKESSPDKGIMEIIVGKHRNGELGTVKASYLGEFTRVENLARGDYGNE